ncbi:hypothetical protein V8C37DRAFT_401637 [Trichoderma ceciliae]
MGFPYGPACPFQQANRRFGIGWWSGLESACAILGGKDKGWMLNLADEKIEDATSLLKASFQMSNKITDARLEWLEETRRRKSMLIKKLEEEERKMMGDKDMVSSSADNAAATPKEDADARLQDTLNTYQLNIDRFKEELAAIEREFESWQEMGFSLPASK